MLTYICLLFDRAFSWGILGNVDMSIKREIQENSGEGSIYKIDL